MTSLNIWSKPILITIQNNTDKEIVGSEELQRDFRQYTNSTKTIENYGGNHLHCKIKIEI
ncbi:hypothetical protein B8A31_07535 [Dolosigranulum pigrum]|nr:hypothetical protein FE321_07815 [Dolosigranulum pigrum]RAN51098.1 hypothetical protein B8A31_07535 [Dolosigranulum pigrum]